MNPVDQNLSGTIPYFVHALDATWNWSSEWVHALILGTCPIMKYTAPLLS